MKSTFSIFCVLFAVFFKPVVPVSAQVNVTQFHNHQSRDGLYIDPAFTRSAAVNLARDLTFDGTILGNVYAQPLYMESGPADKALSIGATEENNVLPLIGGKAPVFGKRNGGEPVSA